MPEFVHKTHGYELPDFVHKTHVLVSDYFCPGFMSKRRGAAFSLSPNLPACENTYYVCPILSKKRETPGGIPDFVHRPRVFVA